ncbi:putative reverse transcriptase domain-containing protein [Tanacetum coccineum]
MLGRPPVNSKKDRSKMKNQKHVARPPRSMTCKNCGETGHNKNGCEKPKVPDEQANPPNKKANPPSQQANPLKKKDRPMVNDLVNARVPSQSIDKFVTARGGIWMGGTNASGSNRGRGSARGSNKGRGSASGSNSGRGSASGSNRGSGSACGSNRGRGRGRGRASGSNKVLSKKPVVDKYILLDEDDLVDVQVEEEVDTRAENVPAADAYENVATEQDENQDEASRHKRNYEEFWESHYKAGYKKPRRTG